MGSKETVAKIKADKAIPDHIRIAVSPHSTVDYVAQTCLAFLGGKNESSMTCPDGSPA